MGDVDGAGVQMEAVLDFAQALGRFPAIFEVADDGRLDGGQMDADLVGAARHRAGGDPAIFLAGLPHHGIIGDGMLGVFVMALGRNHALIACRGGRGRSPWPAPA